MSNILTDQSQVDNVLEQIIEAAQTVIALAEALGPADNFDNIDEKIRSLNILDSLFENSKIGKVIKEILDDYKSLLP